MPTAPPRPLFDGLVASSRTGARRRARASLPVSFALHGAGVVLLLALPAFAPLELPPQPPSGPVVFHLPQPVAVVHAASQPLPARRPAAAAPRRSESAPVLRAATQAAPSAIPDALPAPDDVLPSSAFGGTLPFGAGCDGPGCIVGLIDAGGARAGGEADGGDGTQGAGRVLVSGRDVSPPLKLHDVRPAYPEVARRVRVQGAVVIACTIAPDGRVADARVVSGPALLDAAALDAVRQWRYRPTLVGGAPVAVMLTVTVYFRLAP